MVRFLVMAEATRSNLPSANVHLSAPRSWVGDAAGFFREQPGVSRQILNCIQQMPNFRTEYSFFFFCRSLRRYRPEKTHYIILPIMHFSSSKHMPASPMSDHAAARRHDVDAQLVVLARHERRKRIGRPAPKPTPN